MSEDIEAMCAKSATPSKLPSDADRRLKDISERIRWSVHAPEGMGSTVSWSQKLADAEYIDDIARIIHAMQQEYSCGQFMKVNDVHLQMLAHLICVRNGIDPNERDEDGAERWAAYLGTAERVWNSLLLLDAPLDEYGDFVG